MPQNCNRYREITKKLDTATDRKERGKHELDEFGELKPTRSPLLISRFGSSIKECVQVGVLRG